jgi:hypothetical protein
VWRRARPCESHTHESYDPNESYDSNESSESDKSGAPHADESGQPIARAQVDEHHSEI